MNELKELNVHPEQKDASYNVGSKDFKDWGPTNTAIMTILLVPLTLFCLGVVFAPARYNPEPAPEAPVEAAAEEASEGAATAEETQKPAEIKEAGAPAKAAPATETK